MKDRIFDARALDVQAFCAAGASLDGDWPLAAMLRLAESFCGATDGHARWEAGGSLRQESGAEAQRWLELRAEAEIPLECQRCLQPMIEALRVDRRFRFVRSEEEAATLDEESDDDVLAMPARLDLVALLEDELILALPIVPRHPVCPLPLPQAAELAQSDAAEHPFAVLAALRAPAGDKGHEPE